MKIDFKALLIGLLLGICVPLSMAHGFQAPKGGCPNDGRLKAAFGECCWLLMAINGSLVPTGTHARPYCWMIAACGPV
jgi:hypothetical protein